MLKRLLSFWDIRYVTVLIFIIGTVSIIEIINSPENIKTIVLTTFAVYIILILALIFNGTVLSNLKYIITGNIEYIAKENQSEELKILIKARTEKEKPLFVSVNGKYLYVDNNFKD